MARFTKETAADHGRRGGHQTAQRHGTRYMQTIGAMGFNQTVKRHWNGDRAAYVAYLRERSLLISADRELLLLAHAYYPHLLRPTSDYQQLNFWSIVEERQAPPTDKPAGWRDDDPLPF